MSEPDTPQTGDAPPSSDTEAGGTAPDTSPPDTPAAQGTTAEPQARPSYLFLGVLAGVSLLLDVATKAWAEMRLAEPGTPAIIVIEDHLAMVYARNPGGAWGLLQNQDEMIRRPFFLVASGLAVVFIVSLYAKLTAEQRALKWGLPLVLGGALGNLADRIVRGEVIDFIDYRASWVEGMNTLIAKVFEGWHVTSHWPTFNVADICICIGVGLMAVDMFTQRRAPESESPQPGADTADSPS